MTGNSKEGNSSQEEPVIIADLQNRVTGSAPRWRMRRDRLIHRATYVMVFNSRNEILVQKRTITKDIYPGLLEMASGGVVRAGESYETSAMRELEEETGIRSVCLNFHFDFYFEDRTNRVWGRTFSCTWDGSMKFQKEEVEWGKFFKPGELEAEISRGNFTPDCTYLYKICKERRLAF